MKIRTHNIQLSGNEYCFRSPHIGEERALAVYFRDLFHESAVNMNYPSTHYDDMDLDKQRKSTKEINEAPSSFAIFVSHTDKIVAHLLVTNAGYPFGSHRALLAMGVLKRYQGVGIGSNLIKLAQKYAEQVSVLSIELRVRTFNTAAIKLYEKFSFMRIGEVSAAAKVDGLYVNEYIYVWNSEVLEEKLLAQRIDIENRFKVRI